MVAVTDYGRPMRSFSIKFQIFFTYLERQGWNKLLVTWVIFGIKVYEFSKKATKMDEIFTVNLTLCSKCQIGGEDFVNFCGLFKKT